MYTGKFYIGSEQHKTTKTSRINRNIEDTEKMLSFLKSFSTFNGENFSLHNIVSSIHVGDEVNISEYQSIDQKTIENIKGKIN